jgi:hypothetical protein
VSGLGVGIKTTHHHMFTNAYARTVGKGEDKIAISYTELEGQMLEEKLATGFFNEPPYAPLPQALGAQRRARHLGAADARGAGVPAVAEPPVHRPERPQRARLPRGHGRTPRAVAFLPYLRQRPATATWTANRGSWSRDASTGTRSTCGRPPTASRPATGSASTSPRPTSRATTATPTGAANRGRRSRRGRRSFATRATRRICCFPPSPVISRHVTYAGIGSARAGETGRSSMP